MTLPHDAKLVLVLGALMISAALLVYGANWVMYWTHPTKVDWPLTLVGMICGLGALAWAVFVFYLVLRVLWNSIT